MVKVLMALLACGLLVSAVQAQERKLVWSDEFDYTGLPDPGKWDYEVGFIRNQELQYYTRARKENARVEDGVLIIEARKERYKNPAHRPGDGNWSRSREYADYTAASLHTLGKADWKFGRIEVRAKLPQGKGVWPAIWMMGINRPQVGWPKCGEIDILEFVGHTPQTVHATVHFPRDGKKRQSGDRIKTEKPLDEFHVYAVEWFPDRMDFYFDDQKYFTFPIDQATDNGDNPFRKPHYLILNFALGGSWGRDLDESILPQKYIIDYVRVYKQSPQ